MAHKSFIIPTPTSKDLERFWELVDKNGPIPSHKPELGPCYIWDGPLYPYGRFPEGSTEHYSLDHKYKYKRASSYRKE